ncbi:dephospho-CoA kinase [Canibacter zhoujuaniae]|uniref:dephospho-CoA kinase n=1 Tax=Canibacter zhoujuaniae TaxID=2708343 RepID=UPI00141D9DB9|nr:dephospho-CoA kinase [Canibacter zhoujuaniae]
MVVFALSGGIGAGKSTVADMFTKLGAYSVDADELAREAVAPGSRALANIAKAFGDDLLLADGSLDRLALGQIVFASDRKLKQLEAIVHPEVQRLGRECFKVIEKNDPNAIIVYQVPLLVEAQLAGNYAGNIILSADPRVRLSRLVENRGMSVADAQRRIDAQASEAERLAVADWVIQTDVTQEETAAQVARVFAELKNLADPI